MEVLINTRLISELIEKGDFFGVRETLEKSMAEQSQTFEADIARMILAGKIDRKEGLAHADSPSNLMWRLENDFTVSKRGELPPADNAEPEDDGPSFTDFTLDVKH